MPRKTIPKTATRPAHAPHAPYAPLFMVVIVALLTIGLLLVWRELPLGPKPAPTAPITDVKPVPATPATDEQRACEAAKGKWVECGNPCHGQDTEACVTKCEPQCLCGGIAGWMCPKNQTCTDYEPSATTPDALGVCRSAAPVVMPSEPIRPRPANSLCDDRNFICIDDEVENSLLANPFTVKGSGLAFENVINWKLVDGNGVILEEGFAMAQPSVEYTPGDFTIRAFLLSAPKTVTGTLEVFEYSAKDGTPVNVVKIPVRLPQQTMKRTLHATPVSIGNDCSVTVPLAEEIANSSLPVEATLRALLKIKPAREDDPQDYSTSIPERTELKSIVLSRGTLNLVFSQQLEAYGGGSCAVASIRSQIEKTAKQFPSVQNVVISVEGKTAAETLQP